LLLLLLLVVDVLAGVNFHFEWSFYQSQHVDIPHHQLHALHCLPSQHSHAFTGRSGIPIWVSTSAAYSTTANIMSLAAV